MQVNRMAKQVFINVIFAFAAQGLSLILSFLMSLIVPKVLGVEEYGYWQLFLFYSSYVGFFHFGLNDGIYLRCGGIAFDRLDHAALGSQFRVSASVQLMMALGTAGYAFLCVPDPSGRFVMVMTALYLFVSNACGFLDYVFQAGNRTKIYSLSVMINKVFFIFAVLFLLVFREKHFQLFVIFYLTGQMLALIYSSLLAGKIVRARMNPLRPTLHEIGANISVGINLMLSNIADILIVGVGRFVIVGLWGIIEFGKFSFALSLTTFILQFISQVSMVLFPALRQTDEKRLFRFYQLGRDILGIFLSGVFLAYLPVKYILGLWLPQYQDSLKYLALLLPLCTFDGKMQMLCGTYLKVLRKERVLLGFNTVSLALSVVFSLIGGYVIHSVYAIVISLVIAVACRSILSELYLSRLMQISVVQNLAAECLLAAVFVSGTWLIGAVGGFLIYLAVFAVYLICSGRRIRVAAGLLKCMLSREEHHVLLTETPGTNDFAGKYN